MSRKLLDNMGELQRAVIEVVWELKEASVHQVRNRLCRKKKLAYTTILTAMQKLEKAGWLRHRNEGKVYIYIPTRSPEEAGAKSVRKFVERMFEGDTVLMFQHLVNDSKLTYEELAELRKMINKKRKEKRNDK